jgi:predicted branched-subunit amino acid permease
LGVLVELPAPHSVIQFLVSYPLFMYAGSSQFHCLTLVLRNPCL